MADKKNILIVSDDGSVYSIDPSDIARVAKKVPLSQLSPSVQHETEAARPNHGHAQIFVAHSDIFSAAKEDIQTVPHNAALSTLTSSIFATNSFIFKEGYGPGDK
jgi:hypothetical protein